MTEAEILFPVQCPVCAQQALTGFRISVVADALRTGEIRLYALCHVVGWEASEKEIFLLQECLEAIAPEGDRGERSSEGLAGQYILEVDALR
jgi:hypothetical protein